MKKYYVLVEGNNLLLEVDDKKVDMGFYTFFYFETDLEFKVDILRLIRNTLLLRLENNGVDVCTFKSSFFYVKELNEVEGGIGEIENGGFTFFNMTKMQILISTLIFHVKRTLHHFNLIDSLKKPILLSQSYETLGQSKF